MAPRMPDLISAAKPTVGWEEKRNAAQIIDFFKKNGVENVDPRVTAWCAAYVDAVLAASGAEQRKSLRAADFLTYGDEAKTPGAGNVVVFKPLAANSSGHVGIVTGIEGDRVRYIAGNDGNMVAEDSLPLSKVAGFRMPRALGGQATIEDTSFGGLPQQTGFANTSTPMQMPDLSPVPPPEGPKIVETASDNSLGKALAAFTSAMSSQQPQKPVQVAQAPQMPPIRTDPAPRPRPIPVQATDRTSSSPRKANLSAIFGP